MSVWRDSLGSAAERQAALSHDSSEFTTLDARGVPHGFPSNALGAGTLDLCGALWVGGTPAQPSASHAAALTPWRGEPSAAQVAAAQRLHELLDEHLNERAPAAAAELNERASSAQTEERKRQSERRGRDRGRDSAAERNAALSHDSSEFAAQVLLLVLVLVLVLLLLLVLMLLLLCLLRLLPRLLVLILLSLARARTDRWRRTRARWISAQRCGSAPAAGARSLAPTTRAR